MSDIHAAFARLDVHALERLWGAARAWAVFDDRARHGAYALLRDVIEQVQAHPRDSEVLEAALSLLVAAAIVADPALDEPEEEPGFLDDTMILFAEE